MVKNNFIDWCIKNHRETFLTDWDYPKNGISAENVSKGTHHASYKVIRSSYPEKTVYFYLKKKFNDIISNDRLTLNGKELDIFIPSIKCAIEYDGSFYHLGKDENEAEKNKLCEHNKILLIRIREKGLCMYENSTFLHCISMNEFTSIEAVLKEICLILNLDFNELDYNLERDSQLIFSLVEKPTDSFNEFYQECLKYYNKYGNLNVPVGYIGENGKDLHRWLINVRTGFKNKTKVYLTPENIAKLREIGMVFETISSFDKYYPLAEEFYRQNGHLRIKRGYIVGGVNLGNWIKKIRRDYFDNKLSKEQIQKMNKIKMIWRVNKS